MKERSNCGENKNEINFRETNGKRGKITRVCPVEPLE